MYMSLTTPFLFLFLLNGKSTPGSLGGRVHGVTRICHSFGASAMRDDELTFDSVASQRWTNYALHDEVRWFLLFLRFDKFKISELGLKPDDTTWYQTNIISPHASEFTRDAPLQPSHLAVSRVLTIPSSEERVVWTDCEAKIGLNGHKNVQSEVETALPEPQQRSYSKSIQ
ncbi:hypothetical protein BS17DRAFT_810706 [Gyrodon lividus]|nr:hypothetical protein BS17DRAFT_810706 [Gyrodon lividus]